MREDLKIKLKIDFITAKELIKRNSIHENSEFL